MAKIKHFSTTSFINEVLSLRGCSTITMTRTKNRREIKHKIIDNRKLFKLTIQNQDVY